MPKPKPEASALAMQTLFEEGRQSWPKLEVPFKAFSQYLLGLGQREPPDPARAADLYLACACVLSAPGAIEAFDRAYLSKVGTFLARQKPSPAFVDEVRQLIGVRLFVGREGQPRRILDYRGEGSLLNWLKITALRTAINLQQASRVALGERPSAPAPDASLDPELAHLKRRYREPFNNAFRRAVRTLSPEQRSLLQRHYAEGATLDELASALGVHRATVARRLAAVRSAVIDEARRLLRAELGANRADLESLIRMMRSQVDLTLTGLMREA